MARSEGIHSPWRVTTTERLRCPGRFRPKPVKGRHQPSTGTPLTPVALGRRSREGTNRRTVAVVPSPVLVVGAPSGRTPPHPLARRCPKNLSAGLPPPVVLETEYGVVGDEGEEPGAPGTGGDAGVVRRSRDGRVTVAQGGVAEGIEGPFEERGPSLPLVFPGSLLNVEPEVTGLSPETRVSEPEGDGKLRDGSWACPGRG